MPESTLAKLLLCGVYIGIELGTLLLKLAAVLYRSVLSLALWPVNLAGSLMQWMWSAIVFPLACLGATAGVIGMSAGVLLGSSAMALGLGRKPSRPARKQRRSSRSSEFYSEVSGPSSPESRTSDFRAYERGPDRSTNSTDNLLLTPPSSPHANWRTSVRIRDPEWTDELGSPSRELQTSPLDKEWPSGEIDFQTRNLFYEDHDGYYTPSRTPPRMSSGYFTTIYEEDE